MSEAYAKDANVYVINRDYEDLAEPLNALGATIETSGDSALAFSVTTCG